MNENNSIVKTPSLTSVIPVTVSNFSLLPAFNNWIDYIILALAFELCLLSNDHIFFFLKYDISKEDSSYRYCVA